MLKLLCVLCLITLSSNFKDYKQQNHFKIVSIHYREESLIENKLKINIPEQLIKQRSGYINFNDHSNKYQYLSSDKQVLLSTNYGSMSVSLNQLDQLNSYFKNVYSRAGAIDFQQLKPSSNKFIMFKFVFPKAIKPTGKINYFFATVIKSKLFIANISFPENYAAIWIPISEKILASVKVNE